jgi:hypothetical protein
MSVIMDTLGLMMQLGMVHHQSHNSDRGERIAEKRSRSTAGYCMAAHRLSTGLERKVLNGSQWSITLIQQLG